MSINYNSFHCNIMVQWKEYGLWGQIILGSKPVPLTYLGFSSLKNINTILPGRTVVRIRKYAHKVFITHTQKKCLSQSRHSINGSYCYYYYYYYMR